MKLSGHSCLIFTKDIDKEVHKTFINRKYQIVKGFEDDLMDLLENSSTSLIHWFRTNSSLLFDSYFKKYSNTIRPPILLTHCQVPTRHDLRLSISEIKYTDHFIFITKMGYNHPHHHIIPESRKSMIYFGTQNIKYFDPKEDYSPNGRLKYGRGSDLVKCPDDLIGVYERIEERGIDYSIVGRGSEVELHKLRNDIRKSNISKQVKIIDQLDDKEWMEYLHNLDVFVYFIPKRAYSAIDGVVQDAMLTGLPIVYLGPKAPTELMDHNKDALIARDASEFVRFCNELAKRPDERRRLGQNARKKILKKFNYQETVNAYSKVYSEIVRAESITSISTRYYLEYIIGAIWFFILQKRDGIRARLRKIYHV